jgi:hypothetical protein
MGAFFCSVEYANKFRYWVFNWHFNLGHFFMVIPRGLGYVSPGLNHQIFILLEYRCSTKDTDQNWVASVAQRKWMRLKTMRPGSNPGQELWNMKMCFSIRKAISNSLHRAARSGTDPYPLIRYIRVITIGPERRSQNWKKMNGIDSLCLKEFPNKFYFGKFPENSWKIA